MPPSGFARIESTYEGFLEAIRRPNFREEDDEGRRGFYC